MACDVNIGMCADGSRARKEVQKTQQSFLAFSKNTSNSLKNISRTMAKTGKNMSLFVTGPIVAAGVAAVKAASDFEEMRSKFNVVFGDFANEAERWADGFSSAVNRSRADVMGWMASLQDTFVPLGFARDASADMSKALAQLTVDVASFNNVAESDVLRDFQSALVGNTETVRKYGVIITQAQLSQELMNMGVEGGVQAATEQQKVLARMNIILKGTTDAQGDATRTAGSFANVMRGMKAAIQDLFINFGNLLLPVLTKVVQKITALIRWFADLDVDTKKIIITISGIAAAIGPVILAISALVGALGAVLSPVGLVIAGVAALGVAGFLLVKNWDKVSEFLTNMWNDLKRIGEQIFNALKMAIFTYARGLLKAVDILSTPLKALGIEFKGLQKAQDFLTEQFQETREEFQATKREAWATSDAFSGIREKMGGLKDRITELIERFRGLKTGTGDYEDQLLNVQDTLNNLMQNTATQAPAFSNAMIMSMDAMSNSVRNNSNTLRRNAEEQSKVMALLLELSLTAEFASQSFETAWTASLESAFSTTDAFGDQMKKLLKDLFSNLLVMLGRQLAIASVGFFLTLQFGKGAAAAALSAAAFAGAAAIRALQQGGVVPGRGGGDVVPILAEPGEVVLSKETVQRNAAEIGRMQGGMGEGGAINIYIGGELIFSTIEEGIQNRNITVRREDIV